MVKPKEQLVMVGLSGGVDSAVAALLLKKQGYHVEAIFMQNWQDPQTSGCTATKDLEDAAKIAKLLKIKLHEVNFALEYSQKVFQHFLDEYATGRTPNPDVLCNKEIKFGVFLKYAKALGADLIATGHYAQVKQQQHCHQLLTAADNNKDQTYFLYLLNQAQLMQAVFPLGKLAKKKVREIAKKQNLPNHNKKDSTGICFIGERKFRAFLGEYLLPRPGNIITVDNKIIGQHSGLMFYTIGQRQGLGIGGQKNLAETPWYVAAKDQKNNHLIVTQDKNDPNLMRDTLLCEQNHWISGQEPLFPLNCQAKVRYRNQAANCIINKASTNTLAVKFSQPQWAITPGQSVVFYKHHECLGGGIIN